MSNPKLLNFIIGCLNLNPNHITCTQKKIVRIIISSRQRYALLKLLLNTNHVVTKLIKISKLKKIKITVCQQL